jgi:GntR family transcriptional regulator, transcriptional repressor for pyruvate dehydrogenase complex
MPKAAAIPDRRFRKMSEIIADELRRRIGRGELSEGDLLPNERLLQEEFEVSRPTLREAMRILEAEGLIVSPRGGSKGARVTSPTADQAARYAGLILQVRGATIADIFALRTLVAPAAARALAETAERDVTRLRALLDEMREARPSPRELGRILHAFDEELLGQSGNEALKLVGQMIAHIAAQHRDSIPETLAGLPAENARGVERSPGLLVDMVDAIETGNGALAEQLMRTIALQTEDYHRRRTSERLSVIG